MTKRYLFTPLTAKILTRILRTIRIRSDQQKNRECLRDPNKY